jgi:hypothetical protein
VTQREAIMDVEHGASNVKSADSAGTAV